MQRADLSIATPIAWTNGTMAPQASTSKTHQWPHFPKSTFAQTAFIICLLIEGKERGKEEEGSERGSKEQRKKVKDYMV